MTKNSKRGTLSSALLTAASSSAIADRGTAATVPAHLDARAVMAAVFAPSLDQAAPEGDILVKKGAASASAFRRSGPPPHRQEQVPSEETPVAIAAPVLGHEFPNLPQTAARTSAKWHLGLGIVGGCAIAALALLVFTLSPPPRSEQALVSAPSAFVGQQGHTTPVTSPKRSAASAQDTAGLVARGNALLDKGDIVSARLYYEQAADAGDGRAAMLMGATFDPAFLDRAGTRGLRGDIGHAAAWYRRARDLGERDAAPLLAALDSR